MMSDYSIMMEKAALYDAQNPDGDPPALMAADPNESGGGPGAKGPTPDREVVEDTAAKEPAPPTRTVTHPDAHTGATGATGSRSKS